MTVPSETDARHTALLARGQAALNAGRFDEVREICAEVFALAPGSVNGFWLYVTSGKIAPGDVVFARIENAVGGKMPDALASQLWFMLGKGYDDMGRLKEAFGAFVTANRLKAASLKTGGYEPAKTRQLARAMVTEWGRLAVPPRPPAPPRMIFVLGMPRSGTSLMAQMLGAHPGVTNLGEQVALGSALTRPEGPGNRHLAFLRGLDEARLRAARQAYLSGIGAADHPGQVLVDKMPENYWFCGVIGMLFPDAVLVHMRRDRLASCWSAFRNDFRDGHSYSTDFNHLLAQHDTQLSLTEAARRQAGDTWHEVWLDDLTADPAAVLTPVLQAAGLGWDPACLAPERGGEMATLSKWQVRQGIDPAMAKGWRAYLPFITAQWGVKA